MASSHCVTHIVYTLIPPSESEHPVGDVSLQATGHNAPLGFIWQANTTPGSLHTAFSHPVGQTIPVAVVFWHALGQVSSPREQAIITSGTVAQFAQAKRLLGFKQTFLPTDTKFQLMTEANMFLPAGRLVIIARASTTKATIPIQIFFFFFIV